MYFYMFYIPFKNILHNPAITRVSLRFLPLNDFFCEIKFFMFNDITDYIADILSCFALTVTIILFLHEFYRDVTRRDV